MTNDGRRREEARVEVARFALLTEPDMTEWRRLHSHVYPPGGPPALGSDLQWAPLDPETDWSVRLWAAGELRACGWVTERTVTLDGRDTRAAGVRGVMTHPAYRRLGFGRAVMAHVHELVDGFGVPLALLFSSTMAASFYATLGWQTVTVPVICAQPAGRITYTTVIPPDAPVMIRLRDEAAMPRAFIDVRGLPW
jgi:GNAT superfamily N-acetyltransferase